MDYELTTAIYALLDAQFFTRSLLASDIIKMNYLCECQFKFVSVRGA
jgi:hypothetical protein